MLSGQVGDREATAEQPRSKPKQLCSVVLSVKGEPQSGAERPTSKRRAPEPRKLRRRQDPPNIGRESMGRRIQHSVFSTVVIRIDLVVH
jgi:hypothetical protein